MRNLLLALALFAGLSSPAFAARLANVGTGNINAAATWGTIDSTSYANSESVAQGVTSTPNASSTWTTTGITLTQIGVKIASRAASPSGTFTIKLANVTAPGTNECSVTINVSDVVTASATIVTGGGDEGGWVFVACGATLTNGQTYNITLSTSAASGQVSVFTSAGNNWDRILVTNTTATPAAGDQLWIAGLTASGALTTRTVTINTTVLVNYGNVANTTVDPSISISNGGVLASAVTASTAFVFEHAGPMVIYNGGTFTLGTSGSRIPLSSSMTYTQNSTVEGDTGLDVRNGGTINTAGDNSRSVIKTVLTATANAGATSITTADSTGWLSGDSIVVAGTTIVSGASGPDSNGSLFDAVALSGNASGTSVPTAALSFQHLGVTVSMNDTQTGQTYTFPHQAAAILLNRNVNIQGSGATTNGYVHLQANSIVSIDWTRLNQISGGAAATGQRGLESDTGPSGSLSITNSSFTNGHNTCVMLGGSNTAWGGVPGASITMLHNVIYNCATTSAAVYGIAVNLNVSPNPYWDIEDLTILRTAYVNFQETAIYFGTLSGVAKNITVSGSGQPNTPAILLQTMQNAAKNGTGGQIGNQFGPFTTYANVGWVMGVKATSGINGTIAGLYSWHEAGRIVFGVSGGKLTIDPFYGNVTAFGFYFPSSAGANLTVRNGIYGWDFNNGSGAFPVTMDESNNNITFDNMAICPTGTFNTITFVACGPSTGLISFMHDLGPGGASDPPSSHILLRNSSIESNNGASYPTMRGEEGFYSPDAWIAQDCAACTPVKHGAWVLGGFLSYDTAITHSTGFSLRMTPQVATWSGYISSGSGSTNPGTTLTITSGNLPNLVGDWLTSDGGGFIGGTLITGGSNFSSSLTVSISQSVGSAGAPVHFQSYNNIGGALVRLNSAPAQQGIKLPVTSGKTPTACVWVRPSISTDGAPPWGGSAVTYNGDNPRIINRANPGMGVNSDTALTPTFTPALAAGTWSNACVTLPIAPNDGAYELVVDADQTFTSNAGGWVNIAEWSCTNCGSVNTGQFWWNGAPLDAVTAPSGGGSGSGGGSFFGSMGGWLFWRDLEPTSNDNTPAWLEKAG